ncbi:MAG: DUF3795 domain-containing protein [Kiritimatiellae bacterium]|nr:DUF3795 domain-containing protein [Kiritimatiellia bacterium]MDD5520889.1 DUF3795 domain-containing protein [Kiritimatiellia bacterium]
MTDLKYVTYCGLYCRVCSMLTRIPQQASALQETLHTEGWERFGEYCLPEFKAFWSALTNLSKLEKTCQGCRGGCGDPGCEIRKCALAKNVTVCSACVEYPCHRIDVLAKNQPNLVEDGMRQQKVGLDKWIVEQEEKRQNGFCYIDVRHPS